MVYGNSQEIAEIRRLTKLRTEIPLTHIVFDIHGDGPSGEPARRIIKEHGGIIIEEGDYPFEWSYTAALSNQVEATNVILAIRELKDSRCTNPKQRRIQQWQDYYATRVEKARDKIKQQLKDFSTKMEQLTKDYQRLILDMEELF